MSNIKCNIYLNFFPTLLLNWDEKTAQLNIKNILESFSKKKEYLFFFDTNGLKLSFFDKLETELENFLPFSPSYLKDDHESFVLVHITSERELNNFLDQLDNNILSDPTLVEGIQIFSTSKLSKTYAELLKNKTSQIQKKLHELKSKTGCSGKTLQKVEKSEFYIETSTNFKPFYPLEENDSHTNFHSTFFYELYRLLLFAEVDLNYALHINVDPVIGWINPPIEINSRSGFNISNPFVAFQFDGSFNGTLKNFEYFPRKESISGFQNSLFFSSSEGVNSSTLEPSPSEPSIMRKSPDLYGIKFIQDLKIGSSNLQTSLQISKIFYLRSGLTPAGNYSTTGFELEFWIDEKVELQESLLNQFLYLNFSCSFNCSSELVKFRHLTDVGGVSSEVHSTESSQLILTNSNFSGQLKGIRIVDSVNQFVSDYRFSSSIDKILITPTDSEIKNRTNFEILFCFKVKDFYNYENLQKLIFTIY